MAAATGATVNIGFSSTTAEPAEREMILPVSHPLSDVIPRCRIRNHRGLEALGLAGESVDLRVELGVLHLHGTAAGSLALTADAVLRLRFYRHPPRLRSFGYDAIELWRQGDDPPLYIDTFDSDRAAFGQVIAAFARAVATARGPSALKVGATGLTAIQHRIHMLARALAWLAFFGGAIWALTGPARVLVLAALMAFCWSDVRRFQAIWRAGSLWLRDVDDPADFVAIVERRGIPGPGYW